MDIYLRLERSGVKEYWIIFPSDNAVDVYLLNEDKRYEKTGTYYDDSKIKVAILPNMEIDLGPVFQNK